MHRWDADSASWVELYGPFTACACRPFCGIPPCTGCGEDHGGHTGANGARLCRDCFVERMLALYVRPVTP